MADIGPGFSGNRVVEPGGIGTRTRRSQDFHRLAALQGLGQGSEPAVYATGDATVADIGVNRVGKIHGGSPAGQFENIPLGCEHVHLIREQVDLDVFNELQRITGALLHFQQTLHPLPGPGVAPVDRGAICRFIEPMSGNAVIGHFFHVTGANLDFYGHPVHAHQHGVQGLVAIGLGYGDIVLELTGHRFIQAVDAAKHAITGVDGIDDDPEGKDVHDFRQAFALGFHLLVNAVEMLFPAHDFGVVVLLLEADHYLVPDLLHQLLAIAASVAEGGGDALGPHGMQGAKAQVFKLDAHVVHSQAQGDRRVHLEGFPGNSATFFGL